METTTTKGMMYLVLVSNPEKRLQIQFVPPELNVQRNTQTQAIQIVGRNNPYYQYTAGEKLLTFQLDFYSDQEDRKDVIEKCRWLEGLAYNDGYENPPEKLMIVWGELFGVETWTVKSVGYKLSLFNAEKGMLPQQAYVDLSLGLDVKENVLRSDLM